MVEVPRTLVVVEADEADEAGERDEVDEVDEIYEADEVGESAEMVGDVVVDRYTLVLKCSQMKRCVLGDPYYQKQQ